MTEPDLNDLLNRASSERRANARPSEIAKERATEQRRRSARAGVLATRALKALYRDDYAALLRQAHEGIDRERGPLPGDPT